MDFNQGTFQINWGFFDAEAFDPVGRNRGQPSKGKFTFAMGQGGRSPIDLLCNGFGYSGNHKLRVPFNIFEGVFFLPIAGCNLGRESKIERVTGNNRKE